MAEEIWNTFSSFPSQNLLKRLRPDFWSLWRLERTSRWWTWRHVGFQNEWYCKTVSWASYLDVRAEFKFLVVFQRYEIEWIGQDTKNHEWISVNYMSLKDSVCEQIKNAPYLLQSAAWLDLKGNSGAAHGTRRILFVLKHLRIYSLRPCVPAALQTCLFTSLIISSVFANPFFLFSPLLEGWNTFLLCVKVPILLKEGRGKIRSSWAVEKQIWNCMFETEERADLDQREGQQLLLKECDWITWVFPSQVQGCQSLERKQIGHSINKTVTIPILYLMILKASAYRALQFCLLQLQKSACWMFEMNSESSHHVVVEAFWEDSDHLQGFQSARSCNNSIGRGDCWYDVLHNACCQLVRHSLQHETQSIPRTCVQEEQREMTSHQVMTLLPECGRLMSYSRLWAKNKSSKRGPVMLSQSRSYVSIIIGHHWRVLEIATISKVPLWRELFEEKRKSFCEKRGEGGQKWTHRDAEFISTQCCFVKDPTHVLLNVGIKLLTSTLLTPLYEMRILYTMRSRPAKAKLAIIRNFNSITHITQTPPRGGESKMIAAQRIYACTNGLPSAVGRSYCCNDLGKSSSLPTWSWKVSASVRFFQYNKARLHGCKEWMT